MQISSFAAGAAIVPTYPPSLHGNNGSSDLCARRMEGSSGASNTIISIVEYSSVTSETMEISLIMDFEHKH